MTTSQTSLFHAPPEAASPSRARQKRSERDRTLESLQYGRRRALIDLAHRVAVEMAEANVCAMPSWCVPNGCVTAPQVLTEMKRRGYVAEDEKESRWCGGAFPGGAGKNAKWRRVGYAPLGSKGRAVAVWALIERKAA